MADGTEVALATRTPPVPSFDIADDDDLFLSEAAGGRPATKGTHVEALQPVTAHDADNAQNDGDSLSHADMKPNRIGDRERRQA